MINSIDSKQSTNVAFQKKLSNQAPAFGLTVKSKQDNKGDQVFFGASSSKIDTNKFIEDSLRISNSREEQLYNLAKESDPNLLDPKPVEKAVKDYLFKKSDKSIWSSVLKVPGKKEDTNEVDKMFESLSQIEDRQTVQRYIKHAAMKALENNPFEEKPLSTNPLKLFDDYKRDKYFVEAFKLYEKYAEKTSDKLDASIKLANIYTYSETPRLLGLSRVVPNFEAFLNDCKPSIIEHKEEIKHTCRKFNQIIDKINSRKHEDYITDQASKIKKDFDNTILPLIPDEIKKEMDV